MPNCFTVNMLIEAAINAKSVKYLHVIENGLVLNLHKGMNSVKIKNLPSATEAEQGAQPPFHTYEFWSSVRSLPLRDVSQTAAPATCILRCTVLLD